MQIRTEITYMTEVENTNGKQVKIGLELGISVFVPITTPWLKKVTTGYILTLEINNIFINHKKDDTDKHYLNINKYKLINIELPQQNYGFDLDSLPDVDSPVDNVVQLKAVQRV